MKRRNNKSGRRGRKAGAFLIIIGLLCMAAAGGIVVYNIWDSYRAGEESARIEDALVEKIAANMENPEFPSDPAPDMTPDAGPAPGADLTPAPVTEEISAGEDLLKTVPLKNPEETPYKDMPTEDVEGYRYIGFLEIPSISLSLPVMEDWDYNRLKVSPCRYSGSYYTDDLVICAHNYYRHFTPVKDSLGMGEDVYFTNVMGESIHYKTVNKETVQPMDINAMVSNYRNSTVSSNEWDLTLFTCNIGGQTRAAIRCRRVQP